MKKLMIGLVGALALAASAAEVESNTAGYIPFEVKQSKLLALGTTFVDANSNVSIPVKKVVSVDGVKTGSAYCPVL